MFLSKLDSLNDALKLINDNQKVMGTEEIPLAEAHERVLAEDIIAFHNSPPFDKSAMDGFALKGEVHPNLILKHLKLLIQLALEIFVIR